MTAGISWSFGELEAALAAVHFIDETKRTAFQSRLKNFHRLNYPAGFKAIKGKAAAYSPLQIVEMALAVEMTQLGIPPDRASWVLVSNRWPTLMAVEMVARELAGDPMLSSSETGLSEEALSMFLYFDPAALHPLTLNMPARMLPDLDETANSFFYGGIGIVRESIARWTSGHAARISLINVTAMVGNIASSPYAEGSTEDLAYRRAFFQQLEAEARSIRDQWVGDGDCKDDAIYGLLERDPISDPAVLADRANIPIEEARSYLDQIAKWERTEGHDSNS